MGDFYGEDVAEVDRPTRRNVRCANCGKLLAEMVTQPWRIKCARCKAENVSADHTLTARRPGVDALPQFPKGT